MAEYHVGCGTFGILAGTLNKNKTMWLNKSDVTSEAVNAVACYLLEHDEELRFDYAGEKYCMRVMKVTEDE